MFKKKQIATDPSDECLPCEDNFCKPIVITEQAYDDALAERVTDLEEIIGDGVVQSIVAGDNITIDNTDPLNPIINSTGGGSSRIPYLSRTSDANGEIDLSGESNLPSYPTTSVYNTDTIVPIDGFKLVNAIDTFGFEVDAVNVWSASPTVIELGCVKLTVGVIFPPPLVSPIM